MGSGSAPGMRALTGGLLLALACGGEPIPVSSSEPSPSAGAEEGVGMSVDGEQFLGLALDTGGVPHVSTEFGSEQTWTLSAGIGPDDESARQVVDSTAETVRAIAQVVDPVQPLMLGDTRGHQYWAHFDERGQEALACFGATDATASGRVIRVGLQTMDAPGGAARWAAFTGSFESGSTGEGQLVQLSGLRFRVPTDEGRLTLMHPDEEMTLRLIVTREADPAAPLFQPSYGRDLVDREDTPHPIGEGAVLSRYAIQSEDERSEGAILVAPLGDGRTLVVHANDPNERFDAFIASLRLPLQPSTR